MKTTIGDVGITMEGHVAIVEMQRPPHNFFDHLLIKDLADAFELLDAENECRALVLAAQGKSFCAGMNFQDKMEENGTADKESATSQTIALYKEGARMYSNKKPVVGAIQGAAIGGGLGVALVPDFRVTCSEARFAANFVKIGFHPGFGITHILPKIVGQQKANLLLYTGRRIPGDEAYAWGLADVLTTQEKVREAAVELAQEIAENAPLGVMSTRATMREGLAAAIARQTDHELVEQTRLKDTEDYKEGLQAVNERRVGNFKAR